MGIVKEYSQTENCVSDNLQTKYDESIITETNNYGKKYLEERWKQGDKICKRSKFLELPYIERLERKKTQKNSGVNVFREQKFPMIKDCAQTEIA